MLSIVLVVIIYFYFVKISKHTNMRSAEYSQPHVAIMNAIGSGDSKQSLSMTLALMVPMRILLETNGYLEIQLNI